MIVLRAYENPSISHTWSEQVLGPNNYLLLRKDIKIITGY